MQNSVCPFKNNNRMECNEKHIHDDKQSEKKYLEIPLIY